MSLLATSVGTLLDVDQEACEFLKRDRDSLLGGNFSVILTSPYRVPNSFSASCLVTN